jgi:hypothetical protein
MHKKLFMNISFEWIKEKFETEFSHCADKFELFKLSYSNLGNNGKYHFPGVYIFLDNGKPIKVGKHNINSLKRAKEHIRDDTAGKMKQLGDNPSLELILINLKNENSGLHWVYALEIYFERLLRTHDLIIKSARL